MKFPQLNLRLPVVGLEGERDNIERFAAVLEAMVHPDCTIVMSISHEGDCQAQSPAECNCDEVDVAVDLMRKGSV